MQLVWMPPPPAGTPLGCGVSSPELRWARPLATQQSAGGGWVPSGVCCQCVLFLAAGVGVILPSSQAKVTPHRQVCVLLPSQLLLLLLLWEWP